MTLGPVELTISTLSLSDTAGRRLVDDLSLTVVTGEVLALTGPSGSGKTITVSVALGVMPEGVCVSSGTVSWTGPGGHGTRRWRRRHTGYAAQDPGSALRPDATALAQVAEAAVGRGMPSAQARSVAYTLLAELGLTSDQINSRTHRLSGGQAQRVVVARALIADPALVILDEPTSGLDDVACTTMCSVIARRRATGGATLVITHDDRVLRLLADRAVSTESATAVPTPRATPVSAGSAATVLTLSGFSVRTPTGRPLITDGSLRVKAGEFVAVTGPSGSGKTTLLRAVCGLHPFDGELTIAGQRVPATLPDRDETALAALALVGQNPREALNPAHRVGGVLRRALRHGDPTLSRRLADHAAVALLDRVSVPRTALRRRPDQLSGGQRQRVALARALAGTPTLLVADEMTAALDSTTADQIVALLAELRAASHPGGQPRLAVLAATHDERLIAHADHVLELVDETLATTPPEQSVIGKEGSQ